MKLTDRWRCWRRRRFMRRHGIPESRWRAVLPRTPVLSALDAAEQARLHALASRLLHMKRINGAQGQEVTDDMRVYIAAQACLPILNLGIDYYGGWHEIIVYPGSFVVERDEYEDSGVVSPARHSLHGEAWGRGPVILSWDDIRPGAQPHGPGTSVLLHEFAHKIDMLNGSANGMPPLHAGMSRPAWTAALSQAYDELCARAAHGGYTPIDPYGAEDPAEFFAVVTEAFFVAPQTLAHTYPQVYTQLTLFYRQEPLQRMERYRLSGAAHAGRG